MKPIDVDPEVEKALVKWILYGQEVKDQFTQNIRNIMINQTYSHSSGCRCHYCICLTELGYKKE